MEEFNYKQHWNKAYASKPVENLGWYETDLTPTLQLIEKANLPTTARILNVGAGNTTLIDELLAKKYSSIIASDISDVSLESLKGRIGEGSKMVEFVVDDLTAPTALTKLEPVNLWIDRAVLHFFVGEKDRQTYFNLLKKLVTSGAFVLLAEFSLDGALKCSGLPVHRYSNSMFAEYLGDAFKLVDTFDYVYTMPSGDPRPYVYSLFKRV